MAVYKKTFCPSQKEGRMKKKEEGKAHESQTQKGHTKNTEKERRITSKWQMSRQFHLSLAPPHMTQVAICSLCKQGKIAVWSNSSA